MCDCRTYDLSVLLGGTIIVYILIHESPFHNLSELVTQSHLFSLLLTISNQASNPINISLMLLFCLWFFLLPLKSSLYILPVACCNSFLNDLFVSPSIHLQLWSNFSSCASLFIISLPSHCLGKWCGLNYVLKFICWSPALQCDYIWKWDF